MADPTVTAAPAFPRNEWSTAVWGVPDLYSDHVNDYTFQLAAKFASDRVHLALQGRQEWSVVGTNGLYLAMIDVALQARDRLRTESIAISLANVFDPRSWYRTFPVWREQCDAEIIKIFDAACVVLPPSVAGTVDLESARHYCMAALLAGFRMYADAEQPPPIVTVIRINRSFLGEYEPTSERLAGYGMGVITGSVSCTASEGELLARARRWEDEHPFRPVANPLQHPVSGLHALASPQLGPVPGTNLRWVAIPRRAPPDER